MKNGKFPILEIISLMGKVKIKQSNKFHKKYDANQDEANQEDANQDDANQEDANQEGVLLLSQGSSI